MSIRLSAAVVKELRELSTHKTYVPDSAQLREGVERAIRDSWRFHETISAGPCLENSKMHAFIAQGQKTEARFLATKKALELALAQYDTESATIKDVLTKGADAFCEVMTSALKRGDRPLSLDGLLAATRDFLVALSDQKMNGEVFAQSLVRTRAKLRSVAEDPDRLLIRYFRNPPARCQRRSRGRPAGSKAHVECRRFVSDLLTAAGDAGGRFVFNKNYPENGTLLPALRLLRPYVPQGATSILSPGLLAEICATWRASRGRKIDGSLPS